MADFAGLMRNPNFDSRHECDQQTRARWNSRENAIFHGFEVYCGESRVFVFARTRVYVCIPPYIIEYTQQVKGRFIPSPSDTFDR